MVGKKAILVDFSDCELSSWLCLSLFTHADTGTREHGPGQPVPYSLSSGAAVVFTDVLFALNTQPKKLRFTKRKILFFFSPRKILKELKNR